MKFNFFNLKVALTSTLLAVFVFMFTLQSCTRKQRSDNYHYFQSFDELKGWVPEPQSLTDELVTHSGKYCVYTNDANPYSPTLKLKFNDIDKSKPKKIKATVWCYTTSKFCKGSLCFQIKNPENEYKLWVATPFEDVVSAQNTWTKVEVLADIPQSAFYSENEIAMYVWNTGKDKIFLDDFALEFFK